MQPILDMIRSAHRKDYFHLLAARSLTQFIGFGTVLLVAKFLTPVELGEARILQSYGALFVAMAGFDYHPIEIIWLLEKYGYQVYLFDSGKTVARPAKRYNSVMVAVKPEHLLSLKSCGGIL